MKLPPKPKYELERYRQFIRDAAPYVSILLGQRIQPTDADKLTDEQITAIGLLIDDRADDLKKAPPKK